MIAFGMNSNFRVVSCSKMVCKVRWMARHYSVLSWCLEEEEEKDEDVCRCQIGNRTTRRQTNSRSVKSGV